MEHVYSLNDAHPTRPTLLTVGSFDGVHRGHQTLITDLVEAAHARGWLAAVVTFYPHPSVVLNRRHPAFYIGHPEEKAAMLAGLGVDITITHPFDNQVAKISADEFLRQLRHVLDFRELWCGTDFALGHRRQGTVSWLKQHAPTLGYALRVSDPVETGGKIISSSRVRRALRAGDIDDATHCLGRPFRLPGTVIEGAKRGQAIGTPTANLEIWEEHACPATGVYAGYAWHGPDCLQAAINIGYRPTFQSAQAGVSIEAHLLDFEGDLYGQWLTLDFVARLRSEIQFTRVADLVAQIHDDIGQTRDLLSRGHPASQQAPGTDRPSIRKPAKRKVSI